MHVSNLLSNRLYWLRVSQRIQFKLSSGVQVAARYGPSLYLTELSADDERGRLQSAEHGDLITPRSTTKFGDRAIAVSGPLAWNSLPTSVLNASLLSSFKSGLKDHLFI